MATVLGAALVAAQIAAAAWGSPGPGDAIGSFAMWGMRTHRADLVAVAVIAAATGAALSLADRLRLEPLARAGPTSCPSSASR